MSYCLKYFLLNILSPLLPHPKIRALWLKLLGASIGEGVRIENVRFIQIQYPVSNLQCGNNAFVGTNVVIDLSAQVSIGKNSLVGPGCSLLTHQDAGSFFDSRLSEIYPRHSEGILIDENVWIGADSTLLPGSSIEKFSVVGAKSLVRGTIPARALAFGIPATVKKILVVDY